MRAIDADALINEIKKETKKAIEQDDRVGSFWLGYIAGLVIKQPTAQPEPKWIPVSERLPEEHEWIGTKKFGTTISDEVYVTFENEKGERFCQHMKFQNGKLSSYDQFHMDTWFKGSKPIAWMPLPKPFEGGIK